MVGRNLPTNNQRKAKQGAKGDLDKDSHHGGHVELNGEMIGERRPQKRAIGRNP